MLCFLIIFNIFSQLSITLNCGKYSQSCPHLSKLEIQVNAGRIIKKLKGNFVLLSQYSEFKRRNIVTMKINIKKWKKCCLNCQFIIQLKCKLNNKVLTTFQVLKYCKKKFNIQSWKILFHLWTWMKWKSHKKVIKTLVAKESYTIIQVKDVLLHRFLSKWSIKMTNFPSKWLNN